MRDFWDKKWISVVTDERKDKKEALREKTNEEVVEELELAVVLINSVEKSLAADEPDEAAKYLSGARRVILALMGIK